MASAVLPSLRGLVFSSLLVVFAAFGLIGCGGGSECDDVSCEFGVCQAGACVNPDSCTTDMNCLPGSVCAEEGVCKALTACSTDSECDSGSCQNGACTNPETCETNDDCFERTYCAEDGTCQPDPCNTFQCTTGQCARGTKTCESKESCTLETEGEDCVEGERCLDGNCYAPEAYCDAMACEQGVCSFEERTCVNADDCKGDSANCLDGYYCNDANECVEDLCTVNNVECTDGGVCVPSLGECENADPCASNDECLSGHLCVEGTCRLEENACGDAGCLGNQICEHDPDTLEVSCLEATDCETSLGCFDDRQCAGGICIDPVSCEADRFEPNNSAGEATDFDAHSSALAVAATACSGDTDVYSINTRAIPNFPLRGTFVVTAEYAKRDIGLGGLTLELIDPQGNTVATEDSGEMGKDGIVEIRHTLSAAAHGIYTLQVTDSGDISTAGVSYTLSADIVLSDTVDACNAATLLEAGQPLNGNTSDGTSYMLGSSCAGIHNPSLENIYQFELTETSDVTLTVTPTSGNNNVDMAVSVRRACERLATEQACSNTSTSGGEVVDAVLPPGTYYAIVETAEGTSGSSYRIHMAANAVTCSEADNSCLDANTAEVCVDNSTFTSTSCNLGCDPSTGECLASEGDTCERAYLYNGNISETIDWSLYTNRYEMAVGGCVPAERGDTYTRGSEAVYAIPLDAGYGLSARLEFPPGEYGSLYLLSGCLNASASCEAGANDGSSTSETLNYINDTGRPTTVYLVADSRSVGQTTAQLDVQIGEVICSPSSRICNADDNVEQCNGAGTAYRLDETCNYGCDGGVCNEPPNQECNGAIEVVPGTPITEPIDDFTNNLNAGQSCSGTATAGPEAFYKVVTTQADQVVTVEVVAPYDVVLYAVDSCSSSTPSCTAGVDNAGVSTPEILEFFAPTPGEYVVAVDTDSTAPTGNFIISASTQATQCTAYQMIGCSQTNPGTLEYCSALGVVREFDCPSGSCTNAACDNPTGDVCLDAIPTSGGSTHTGDFSTLTADYAPDDNFCPGLNFTQNGPEAVYAIDLLAGETVTADMTSSTTDIGIYIVRDCNDMENSCLNGQDSGGTESATYTASSDERVYIVADSYSSSTTSGTYQLDVTVTP
ncbi:hypothetical protein FIV42_19050 [Persicimonas caeni]|uniref:Peptidase C-terminal archaeal/bacterial domain-containing protein n=1 Tax=Persicimonas caeni TaxID=2292766 RepID=A0A4Y6PWX1_PERCE|nr:PPC domain-containing protein [Persicimonas caeni]QDG52763.1 hypothetical protein FIV42_19050 [Persicimonas caeni]QED33985.1 hypothetical protein FRD00_19045 [Persicimonas caeni]